MRGLASRTLGGLQNPESCAHAGGVTSNAEEILSC